MTHLPDELDHHKETFTNGHDAWLAHGATSAATGASTESIKPWSLATTIRPSPAAGLAAVVSAAGLVGEAAVAVAVGADALVAFDCWGRDLAGDRVNLPRLTDYDRLAAG